MTQSDEKEVRSSQLSFEFSGEPQSSVFEVKEMRGVVTHFVSRDSAAIRREAIERVRRDGIFSMSPKRKV